MALGIHRKFIASVAALSILVAGLGASDASAQNYGARTNTGISTDQAIAAIFGLAVVGAIIANKNKRKKSAVLHPAPVVAPPAPVVAPPPPVVHHQPHVAAPTPKAKPLPKRAGRHALPQQCLRTFQTDNGRKRILGHRCMQRNFPHVAKLPQHCQRQIWTDRGPRSGWGAGCLRKNGFTLAQR